MSEDHAILPQEGKMNSTRGLTIVQISKELRRTLNHLVGNSMTEKRSVTMSSAHAQNLSTLRHGDRDGCMLSIEPNETKHLNEAAGSLSNLLLMWVHLQPVHGAGSH